MAFAFFNFALWATAVAKSGCDISGEGGPGFGPGERGSDVERAIMEASQHPNATNEVSFQLTRPGASAVDQNSASMQWSWRVNISEINFGSLPTNPGELQYPGNAADFHFVNAVNSLSWPGGGELSDKLVRVTGNASGDAGRLCVTLFDLPDLPVNITNQYDAGDNGNCANVIGATCARALLQRASAGGCEHTFLPEEIMECESTFSKGFCSESTAFRLSNTTHSSIIPPTANSSSNMTSFLSGDAFYFSASGSEAAGNNSYFQKAAHQLRILVLTGAANQVVCQRVNSTDSTTSNAASGGRATWYGLGASFGLMALFSQL